MIAVLLDEEEAVRRKRNRIWMKEMLRKRKNIDFVLMVKIAVEKCIYWVRTAADCVAARDADSELVVLKKSKAAHCFGTGTSFLEFLRIQD
ncbi:hypothetical protein ANN_00419 [Periplaneta americana]|uniref:Uncharacterized protein n=1 Tax=Periplaneta americana TaxID=6978 RepID=A0ABQ8TUS2_PERAM|nr:hypothetical protein ANN_00419 [Periplaneta americana]